MRMIARQIASIPRRAVNLTLDAALVADAKALGMNLSRAVEEALRAKVSAEKGRRWAEENREAIKATNARVEREGLWSDDYRLF